MNKMTALLKETKRLKREEGLSVIGFIALWIGTAIYSSDARPYLTDIHVITPFAATCLILIMGTYFWAVMERCLLQHQKVRLSAGERSIFHSMHIMIVLLMLLATWFLMTTHHVVMVILYVFMWLEYINYFHIRLSYLTPKEMRQLAVHRTIKASHLRRALREK